MLDAAELLDAACRRHRIDLSLLVAETALWAAPEVQRRLFADHPTGAFFPNVRRARIAAGEVRNTVVDGIKLDDNSAANQAIKRAIGIASTQLKGFETCHIWPRTAYDARYHTVIANLVLLPQALAALSDHDPQIMAVLQYRSFELYGWHPEEVPTPVRPEGYPDCWRPAFDFTSEIGLSLARRAKNEAGPVVVRQSAAGPPPDLWATEGRTMPAQERNFVVSRIRRWAAAPSQKVHKIVALVLSQEVALPRQQLARAIEERAGSRNGYGAIANLLRSDGNAYGRIFVDLNGRITLHPDVEAEIRSHRWQLDGL